MSSKILLFPKKVIAFQSQKYVSRHCPKNKVCYKYEHLLRGEPDADVFKRPFSEVSSEFLRGNIPFRERRRSCPKNILCSSSYSTTFHLHLVGNRCLEKADVSIQTMMLQKEFIKYVLRTQTYKIR